MPLRFFRAIKEERTCSDSSDNRLNTRNQANQLSSNKPPHLPCPLSTPLPSPLPPSTSATSLGRKNIWKGLCLSCKATAATTLPTHLPLLKMQGTQTHLPWLWGIPMSGMPWMGTRAYSPQLPHPQGGTGDVGEEWRMGKGSRRLGDEQENAPGVMDGCPQDMGRGTWHPEWSMDKDNPSHSPAIPSHQLPQPHQWVWQLIVWLLPSLHVNRCWWHRILSGG